MIHTTLIVFYDLISKSDTTVTKCDFTVDKFASILLCRHPSPYSSVGEVEAELAKVHIFPGFDEITLYLNIFDQYFMV